MDVLETCPCGSRLEATGTRYEIDPLATAFRHAHADCHQAIEDRGAQLLRRAQQSGPGHDDRSIARGNSW